MALSLRGYASITYASTLRALTLPTWSQSPSPRTIVAPAYVGVNGHPLYTLSSTCLYSMLCAWMSMP